MPPLNLLPSHSSFFTAGPLYRCKARFDGRSARWPTSVRRSWRASENTQEDVQSQLSVAFELGFGEELTSGRQVRKVSLILGVEEDVCRLVAGHGRLDIVESAGTTGAFVGITILRRLAPISPGRTTRVK